MTIYSTDSGLIKCTFRRPEICSSSIWIRLHVCTEHVSFNEGVYLELVIFIGECRQQSMNGGMKLKPTAERPRLN